MLVDTRPVSLPETSLYASISVSIFIILSLSWTIVDSGLGEAYFKDEDYPRSWHQREGTK